MLKRSCLRGFLLVVFLLSACSDDGASPDNNKNNGGGGDSSFAIVSVDKDSVYWGEEVAVLLRNIPNGILTAFVHTVPVTIEDQWRDSAGRGGIRFRVPMNASSGQIRIFDTAVVQAKGNTSLTVFPQHIDSFQYSIQFFRHTAGFAGDPMLVGGQGFPRRSSDVEIILGGVSIPLESLDDTLIIARISNKARSGNAQVRFFDSVLTLGPFTMRTPEGSLLVEGHVAKLQFTCNGLFGMFRMQGEFSDQIEEKLPLTYSGIEFDNPIPLSNSDSIILVADEDVEGASKRLELRLKPEQDNRVSGVVRCRFVHGIQSESWDIAMKGMRWMFINGMYWIYSQTSDLGTELTALTYRSESDGLKDTRVYERTSLDGFFQVVITP